MSTEKKAKEETNDKAAASTIAETGDNDREAKKGPIARLDELEARVAELEKARK